MLRLSPLGKQRSPFGEEDVRSRTILKGCLRRGKSFRLHDDLQPVDDLTGFQFLQINDGDAQLGGPVTGGGVADLRGDDGRLGTLAAEAVPEPARSGPPS